VSTGEDVPLAPALAPAAKAEMQLNLKKMRSEKISRYFLQHRYQIHGKSRQLPVCSAGSKIKLRGLLDEEARNAIDRITTRKAPLKTFWKLADAYTFTRRLFRDL
jgi:hypothetical protein